MVSELLYAGKTLAEVAGYDDAFMSWVLCRPRDERGGLIRHPTDLPWWVTTDSRGQWVIKNPVPFTRMFNEIKAVQGLSERERHVSWAQWKRDNPKFGKGE